MRVPLATALVLVMALNAVGAEEGLRGRWTFDEGKGNAARDTSGNNNHAIVRGATYVPGPRGFALRFDGKDNFVDVGKRQSLQLDKAGSIEVWFLPEEFQGGIVNWSTGGGWDDERLVVAFNTYSTYRGFNVVVADGASSLCRRVPEPEKGVWNHLVLTFDGDTISCWLNGHAVTFSQDVSPALEGVPFWIGRCQGLGAEYFKGLIDEVSVYDRALSPDEILARYRRDAAAFGRDVSSFTRPALSTYALPEQGRLCVTADCNLMRPLPEGVAVAVSLVAATGERIGETTIPLPSDTASATALLDMASARTGEYTVNAQLLDRGAKPVGSMSTASVAWPGQPQEFRGVKVLNNLVWELLSDKPGNIAAGDRTYSFTAPKTRWVYARLTADATAGRLSVSLDSGPETRDIIVFEKGEKGTREAMRFLPAGSHSIAIHCDGPCSVEEVTLRSIPELIYARFTDNPHTQPFGPYYGEFLEKYIIPHVNTFVTSRSLDDPLFAKWHGTGRRWFVECTVPRESDGKPLTVEDAIAHISGTVGFSDARLNGVLADEFGDSEPVCAVYAEAVRRLRRDPAYSAKLFYPYANDFYTGEEGKELVKALMEAGSRIAWKQYLKEQSNENAARQFIHQQLVARVEAYRRLCPGSVEHIAVCFGTFSAPPEFLNTNPGVNYKKYLDMQFNIVANHPAFWGTYGLMTYLASYADEETNRWVAHLFRHYGIEGQTAPATQDPYDLDHVRNGDFVRGTEGWTLSPADKDSIRTVRAPRLGWLEGRYPPTSEGDTAILLVRSARKPNVISQEIRNLTPGRLYALRMFSADYDEYLSGKSERAVHAVSVKLDGVQVLPGAKNSFQFPIANCYSHHYGKFDDKNSYWMNYYWRVFRADGNAGKITISDWSSDDAPGGPVGQKLMLNYISVQPYYPPE